jgi:hypothetical protein
MTSNNTLSHPRTGGPSAPSVEFPSLAPAPNGVVSRAGVPGSILSPVARYATGCILGAAALFRRVAAPFLVNVLGPMVLGFVLAAMFVWGITQPASWN